MSSITEILKPVKNIKEMRDAVKENDIVKFVSNYFQSVPGIYVASKAAIRVAPKVLQPAFAKTVQKGLSAAVNWYAKPAVSAMKFAGTSAKRTAGKIVSSTGATSNLAGTGVLAASVLTQHLVSKPLKDAVSQYEGVKYLVTGNASGEFLDKLSKTKAKWWHYVGPTAGIFAYTPLFKTIASKRGDI